METLSDKLVGVIKEESKKKGDKAKDVTKAISLFEKLGLTQKSSYSFPLKDTIGRTLYEQMNPKPLNQ